MMRPLLLLHPLGSAGSFWDTLATAWPGPTVRPDLLGHGSAPLPAVAEGVTGLARHVVAQLDLLGPEGSVVDVVGVSLGGLVAQELAAHRPERVGRVVLADTVVRYPPPMTTMWAERAAIARRLGTTGLGSATLDVWFSDDFRASRPDVAERVVATLAATDDEGYARTCEILAAADTSDLLADITAPVLAVCGTDDGPAFRQAATEQLAPLGDREVSWIPGRHAVPLEQPDRFLGVLRDFLLDHDRDGPAPRTEDATAPTTRSSP